MIKLAHFDKSAAISRNAGSIDEVKAMLNSALNCGSINGVQTTMSAYPDLARRKLKLPERMGQGVETQVQEYGSHVKSASEKKHETHTMKGIGYGVTGTVAGTIGGGLAGGLVGGGLGALADRGLPAGSGHPGITAGAAIGVGAGELIGSVYGSGKAMQLLTEEAADKNRFARQHPYIAGLLGPYSHAYVGHNLESKHASEGSSIAAAMGAGALLGAGAMWSHKHNDDDRFPLGNGAKHKKKKQASLGEIIKTALSIRDTQPIPLEALKASVSTAEATPLEKALMGARGAETAKALKVIGNTQKVVKVQSGSHMLDELLAAAAR